MPFIIAPLAPSLHINLPHYSSDTCDVSNIFWILFPKIALSTGPKMLPIRVQGWVTLRNLCVLYTCTVYEIILHSIKQAVRVALIDEKGACSI